MKSSNVALPTSNPTRLDFDDPLMAALPTIGHPHRHFYRISKGMLPVEAYTELPDEIIEAASQALEFVNFDVLIFDENPHVALIKENHPLLVERLQEILGKHTILESIDIIDDHTKTYGFQLFAIQVFNPTFGQALLLYLCPDPFAFYTQNPDNHGTA